MYPRTLVRHRAGNVVEVVDESGVVVGSLTFAEAPEHIPAHRTGAGFELEFPMTVRLKHANIALTLGRGRHYGWLVGGIPESVVGTGLIWADALPALVAYERFRDSKRPRFQLRVLGELCYLVPSSGRRIRTEPQQAFGDVEVSYPADVWISMIGRDQVPMPEDRAPARSSRR